MSYDPLSRRTNIENPDSSYSSSINISSSQTVFVDKIFIKVHIDTVKRCYLLYSDKLKKKLSISMYGSLFITIFTAYVTSDFKDGYFLTAEKWSDAFCIAGVITLFLSLYYFVKTRKMSVDDNDFVNDLINPNK